MHRVKSVEQQRALRNHADVAGVLRRKLAYGPEGGCASDGVEPLQVREAATRFVVVAANYGRYIYTNPVDDGVGVGAIVD